MKVKELIANLQKFNPELLVTIRGYESGQDDCPIPVTKLLEESNPRFREYFFGKYDISYNQEPHDHSFMAVTIGVAND